MIAFHDLLVVCATVAAIAAVAAAAGVGAVRLLAARSLFAHLCVVAAVTIVTSLAGVVVITVEMLINPHDRDVVLTVVAIAGVAGFAVTMLVGRRVTTANQLLLGAVRELGDRAPYRSPDAALPAEFAALSAELAAANERLAQAHRRERSLEASRRELVAWVSHDLRAPLAGLRAMAEALEDGIVTGAAARAYYAQIRREAERLSVMIDDLFALSRIHAGVLPLDCHPVSLDEVIDEALASTGPLARAKRVRLHGSAVAGLAVRVDVTEFGRALRNLVINAIRHTPAGGSVEVRGSAEQQMACVRVSDACGGIPAGALPRVFDLAFRGESARTPGEGAGLGLSIARGIVEAHAGTITVSNSSSSAGCEFLIKVPRDAGGMSVASGAIQQRA